MVAYHTDTFDSSVLPWSVVTPLSVVIFLGLFKETISDLARHRNDVKSNSQPCFILRKEDEGKANTDEQKGECNVLNGGSIKVPLLTAHDKNETKSCVSMILNKVKRKDVYAGDIILVKNRDIIPADLVLLGSIGDKGVAYAETSSIDGETNLKLRIMPNNQKGYTTEFNKEEKLGVERIGNVVERLTQLSCLS